MANPEAFAELQSKLGIHYEAHNTIESGKQDIEALLADLVGEPMYIEGYPSFVQFEMTTDPDDSHKRRGPDSVYPLFMHRDERPLFILPNNRLIKVRMGGFVVARHEIHKEAGAPSDPTAFDSYYFKFGDVADSGPGRPSVNPVIGIPTLEN